MKHYNSEGFTLVEIMVVVAIIALLAAIAIPNFLRARERGQATTVLNDARILDAAVDKYAVEQNKKGKDPSTWPLLTPYLKPNSRLVMANGKDIFGNPYILTTVEDGAMIDPATKLSFNTTVVPSTFWAGF